MLLFQDFCFIEKKAVGSAIKTDVKIKIKFLKSGSIPKTPFPCGNSSIWSNESNNRNIHSFSDNELGSS